MSFVMSVIVNRDWEEMASSKEQLEEEVGRLKR